MAKLELPGDDVDGPPMTLVCAELMYLTGAGAEALEAFVQDQQVTGIFVKAYGRRAELGDSLAWAASVAQFRGVRLPSAYRLVGALSSHRDFDRLQETLLRMHRTPLALPLASSAVVHGRAYARIGIVGNPSRWLLWKDAKLHNPQLFR